MLPYSCPWRLCSVWQSRLALHVIKWMMRVPLAFNIPLNFVCIKNVGFLMVPLAVVASPNWTRILSQAPWPTINRDENPFPPVGWRVPADLNAPANVLRSSNKMMLELILMCSQVVRSCISSAASSNSCINMARGMIMLSRDASPRPVQKHVPIKTAIKHCRSMADASMSFGPLALPRAGTNNITECSKGAGPAAVVVVDESTASAAVLI